MNTQTYAAAMTATVAVIHKTVDKGDIPDGLYIKTEITNPDEVLNFRGREAWLWKDESGTWFLYIPFSESVS